MSAPTERSGLLQPIVGDDPPGSQSERGSLAPPQKRKSFTARACAAMLVTFAVFAYSAFPREEHAGLTWWDGAVQAVGWLKAPMFN